MAAIPPFIFAFFSATDLALIPPEALQGLTEAQLSRLNPGTISGLSPAQFINIPNGQQLPLIHASKDPVELSGLLDAEI